MALYCKKCNTCTENCPIIEVSGKKNLFEVFFGSNENIWNCSSCFTCEEVCPEKLSVRDEIFEKRRELKLSNFSKEFQNYYRRLLETGNIFVLDEEWINERRKKMGLGSMEFEKIKKELKEMLEGVQ